MATVNKDFKIKSGLIVEGTTGTINGQDILTKKQADQDYIVSLIGGTATSANEANKVVKRNADGDFAAGVITADLVGDVTGQVSDISNHSTSSLSEGTNLYFTNQRAVTANTGLWDTIGAAAAAEAAANLYTDGRETAITNAYEAYADQAEVDAKAYTDTRETAITTAYQNYADAAETDAKAYTDTRETAITTAYQTYADQAETDAKAYTDTRETAITTAYRSYADQAELDAVATANAYTDAEVSALVDSAPELLDTLNELAAAIADNPNYATDAAAAVAGRVAKSGDTMTGDLVLPGAPTLTLHAATKGYVDAAETDAVTSANSYTDGEITTALSTAQGYANTAETDANSYTDSGLALKQDSLTVGDGLDLTGATLNVNSGEMVNKVVNGVSGNSYGIVGNATYLDVTNPTGYNSEIDVDIAALESKLTTDGFASQTDISNAIDAVDTDAIEEGTTNLYHTDARAKASAASLLLGASLTNIAITGNSTTGLIITAENGVADSNTDQLTEGSTNLYFTDSRVTTAIANATHIAPQAIDITWVRREEATWTDVATASKVTCHSAGTSEGSMKYLVRVTASVGGTRHSHVTEVLATVDGANGVAVVEYGTIYTSAEPLATVTVEWNASTSKYDLNVTTANNNSEVMVAATMLAVLD